MKLKNIKQGSKLLTNVKDLDGNFVVLNEGDIIDSTKVDKESFKTSVAGGMLKTYINAGWVVEEKSKAKSKPSKKAANKKVTPKVVKPKKPVKKKMTKKKTGGKK